MQFKRFNDIEGTHRQKTMDFILSEGYGGGDWSVSEKVHGANFSIWYDGEIMKAGKRSSFLDTRGTGENFYNYVKVLEDNRERIITLYNYIMSTKGDWDTTTLEIVVYGEIMGGNYPHPDITKNLTAKSVQSGIYYSPDNHFYVFDITVNGEYLHLNFANNLFDHLGFLYAKELFHGTLSEALKFPNDGLSQIYKEFDLPELKAGMMGKNKNGEDNINIMEGVVLRPVQPVILKSGSRVIFKNKNNKWSEHNQTKKPKAPSEPLQRQAQLVYEDVSAYLSENRLHNVISKFGEVKQKEFGKLLALFIRDTIMDYHKDGGIDDWNKLDKPDVKRINKLINKDGAFLIRENFVNIIDGTW